MATSENEARVSAPECREEPAAPVIVGTYARDSATGRTGLVMAHSWGSTWSLRPVGGGREWEADASTLTRLEGSEALRPEIRRINEGAR
ncbi:hypothetical protein SALBM311S_08214 [Streptomyces alboniger]